MTTSPSRASFWIGLTLGAILTAALMFSIYYVPRKGITFSRTELPFVVVLDQAHGLHAGSPVHVSGIEAGEVTHVSLERIDGKGVRVAAHVSVFDGERFGPMLTDRSVYRVDRSSLLGEMILSITPASEGAPLTPGGLVDGAAPTSFDDMLTDLATISNRLADFMDGRGPGDPSLRRALAELEKLLANLRTFSEKLP